MIKKIKNKKWNKKSNKKLIYNQTTMVKTNNIEFLIIFLYKFF